MRMPALNQEEGPHEKVTVLALWSGMPSLQNCEKKISVVYKPPSLVFVTASWMDLGWSSPSTHLFLPLCLKQRREKKVEGQLYWILFRAVSTRLQLCSVGLLVWVIESGLSGRAWLVLWWVCGLAVRYCSLKQSRSVVIHYMQKRGRRLSLNYLTEADAAGAQLGNIFQSLKSPAIS